MVRIVAIERHLVEFMLIALCVPHLIFGYGSRYYVFQVMTLHELIFHLLCLLYRLLDAIFEQSAFD